MKNTVLIVDDNEMNREILSVTLEEYYSILEAGDGLSALKLLEERAEEIAVILLDLVMPNMDGLEFMEVMKERGFLETIPVLVISGETSSEIEEKCLRSGAYDFIKKPFVPALALSRTRNAITLYNYKSDLEEQIDRQTAQLRRQADELRLQNKKLMDLNEKTIEFLSDVVEARDLTSGAHVHRVKTFSYIMGAELMHRYPEYGLTEEKLQMIALASSTHDVGKIMISDAILLKPAKLTRDEFDLMKKHTVLGCQVLERGKKIWDESYYEYCWQICRWHHEKYDGRGYPDGLVGDEIPIAAQIVSLMDCYDALTTARPYKKPFTTDQAYEMLMNGECGVFNPRLLECLEVCRQELADIAESLSDD